MEIDLAPSTWLGSRTLIVGDINTGKTTLTRQILEGLCTTLNLGPQIMIVDLSPTIPDSLSLPESKRGVGGRVILNELQDQKMIGVFPTLLPARLLAHSQAEAQAIARSNLDRIHDSIDRHTPLDRSILIINDITLYLQAGNAMDLLQWMRPAQTVIANGYLGKQLGAGDLSQREAYQLRILMKGFDRVIPLSEPMENDPTTRSALYDCMNETGER